MSSSRLQRYRVLESLGKGGSGEVFLGIDPFGQSVAIKIQRRPRKRLRFMQEFKLLNEFPHPSLVNVYEFGLLPDGWSYLVLELIEGKSATGYVRSLYGTERLHKCLQIAIKISEAFGSLHQMNWIHGDIKSNNILVDLQGAPHLIDFELARPIKSTGTGKFFGTRSYAPPEQHDGLQLDHSVDVYAMAGVLHKMITNKSVFERLDNNKEAQNRRTTKPSISKRLPEGLRTVLFNALSPDQQKRPRNGYEFAELLRGCLSVPEDVTTETDGIPAMAYLCDTLQQNSLSAERYGLLLWSLTGGDPALINRFIYTFTQHGEWVPSEYHEQVWHYLQHLPKSTQRALYVLACLGGKASTSLLHKFSGISRIALTSQLEKLPHWVRKEGLIWHLYVGAVHTACTHLIPHEEGLVELFEYQSSLPKWAKLCVEALHRPDNILEATVEWINSKSDTLHQWRLLERISENGQSLGIDITPLKERLIHRQNGNWLEALQLQDDPTVERLLSIYESLHPSDIILLESMTRSTNLDVWVVSHALLAEWHILHGHFSKGEALLVPLCASKDVYPRQIGLQQRALLYHHLNQQSRLTRTYQELNQIASQPITERIRSLIQNQQWSCNLLTVEEVPSLYLSVRNTLSTGEPIGEDFQRLVLSLPRLERSQLSVHPLWEGHLANLDLGLEPKDEEYIYIIDPEEDLSCS